jgi:hypothetical protein
LKKTILGLSRTDSKNVWMLIGGLGEKKAKYIEDLKKFENQKK